MTTAAEMTKLIEALAATLDDYLYCPMRTGSEVIIRFTDGRKKAKA